MWWGTRTDIKIHVSINEIIFGIPNPNKDSVIDDYNMIVLYAKYHIYITKKKGNEPDFYEYLRELKQTLILEEQILCNKGISIEKFKWADILACL
jgi:hypothetical protein